MKFIKNNKLLIALLVIAIAFLAAIVIIIFNNISLGTKSECKNEYSVSDELITPIKEEIGNFDKVESLTYDVKCKLVNFIIKVDQSLSIEDARNYAGRIIERLNDETKKNYDIQVLIDSAVESEIYPIAGYKHKSSDMLVWEQ